MIYREAAAYLDDAAGTLRSRIYKPGSQNIKHLKQLYALACETSKYRTALTHIIRASDMLARERKLTLNLALVMVYDLLMGRKRLNCGKCAEKDAILRHKTRLNAEFVKYKLKNPVLADSGAENAEPPVRWIRWNTAVGTESSCSELFDRLKLKEVGSWSEVTPTTWYKDTLVPHLYAIHPSISMEKLPEYRDGVIIVQDRASCIPVTIMNPHSKGIYIDACAAPGNKTSQLAARAKQVTAFERDRKRSKTLAKMLDVAHLSDKVDIKVMDFTHHDPEGESLDGLIVDPSCSGSGIFRSTTVTPERLAKLSDFQYQIMLHALRFDARKVVYSTCSIHEEENEGVVKRLLETPEVAGKWELGKRDQVLPTWERRGHSSVLPEDQANGCVRVMPREDGGIGFFAACFVRKG